MSNWAGYDRALVQLRDKSIMGDRLRARHPRSQEDEALIACNILNRMTEPGRSESFAIGP